jgi:2-polyprenyl-3-methyl-5-hydroxy-6-metoxy-1,4-benzoquinol methylase
MILSESQHERDLELSLLTRTPLKEILSYEICGQNSIRLYDETLPIPNTEDEILAIYKEYKFLHFKSYLRTLMFTSVERRHPELLLLISATRHKKCLDFGSGVGTHAIALCENDNEVTILDIEGPLLYFAIKRMTHRNLPFKYMTNNDTLKDEYYDVVICSDVLEHVYDPINEFYRILSSMKIGGIMHILVSSMIKPSSGHFPTSIQRWEQEGQSILASYCEKISETIYKKTKNPKQK